VLSGLIEMAANLGMETVGEGIEEPSQLDMLRSLHCRYAQGFLFARPLPSDRLDEVLFLGDAVDLQQASESQSHVFPAPTSAPEPLPHPVRAAAEAPESVDA
jgi:predicted signal transduction protein with EAL and GGDEF domain